MNIHNLFKLGMDREIPLLLPMPAGMHLNVGCGEKKIPNTIGLDLPERDADSDDIPWGDSMVTGIHAYHFLEHVKDPVKMLLEFQRVLLPGGVVNIVVPYYTSQMAAQDLDHKSVWTEETWRVLFDNPYYNKNKVEWQFTVGVNIIIGVVERNMCLMTQLIKGEAS